MKHDDERIAGMSEPDRAASVVDARILVVDDNADNVAIVLEVLKIAGYKNVRGTQDAASALEDLRHDPVDLLILDLRMRPLNGFDFLRTLRSDGVTERPNKILVFTADPAEESRSTAADLGASDFLTKPFDAADLVLRVRRLL